MTDYETKLKLFSLYIDNIKYCINYSDKIIEVIKNYDGKVINKRLKTNLEAIFPKDDYISVEVTTEAKNRFELSLCFWNRRSIDLPECHGCIYFPKYHESITVCHHYFTADEKTTWYTYDDNNNARLYADAIIPVIKEYKEKLFNSIPYLLAQSQKVEEYKKTIKQKEEELTNYKCAIDYSIKDFFDIG